MRSRREDIDLSTKRTSHAKLSTLAPQRNGQLLFGPAMTARTAPTGLVTSAMLRLDDCISLSSLIRGAIPYQKCHCEFKCHVDRRVDFVYAHVRAWCVSAHRTMTALLAWQYVECHFSHVKDCMSIMVYVCKCLASHVIETANKLRYMSIADTCTMLSRVCVAKCQHHVEG